jgi:hypothetical protein
MLFVFNNIVASNKTDIFSPFVCYNIPASFPLFHPFFQSKIGDDLTMLLKTKENGSDILDHPAMCMKTNGLIFVTHDVDDKKGT